MDRATKTEIERRLAQSKNLEEHIKGLEDSVRKLKALGESGCAIDITVASATVSGGVSGIDAVVITASTSGLDCFTPDKLRPILQLMISTLSQKLVLLNKEYAAA